jgi:hypothetical protein
MKTLSGWKEIAAHMHQGLRTVQRWERLGLPVHRVGGGKRAPVIGFAEELEAWRQMAPRRLLDEISELKHQVAALQTQVESMKAALAAAETRSARAERPSVAFDTPSLAQARRKTLRVIPGRKQK